MNAKRYAVVSGLMVYVMLTLASFSPYVSAQKNMTEDMVKPAKQFICTGYVVIRNIIGPIAIVILILAGIIWLKSDEEARDRLTAKSLIMNVLIGLTIFLIAAGMVSLITGATKADVFKMDVFCEGIV
jgi:hypothetical protein